MKHLKQILTIFTVALFIFSCNTPERSVGMTTWTDDGTEFKFYLGTDKAIDVVKQYDDLLISKEWDKALEIFADTAKVIYYNGQTVSPKELIEMSRVRDSNFVANDIDYNWNLVGLFSVDLDPSRGGEHISADYNVTYDDGEEQMEFNSILRFYVIDNKIVTINQFNQSVITE